MTETRVLSIMAFFINDNSFIHKSLILNQSKSNKFVKEIMWTDKKDKKFMEFDANYNSLWIKNYL